MRPKLMLSNMLSNYMTLTWEMSPGMSKLISPLNGSFAHVWWDKTALIEVFPDHKAINVFAEFEYGRNLAILAWAGGDLSRAQTSN